ncbi:cytochrome P450 [Microlunatus lacustris]
MSAPGTTLTREVWSQVVDAAVFSRAVPHEAFEDMRASGPVVWVDEPAVDHLPAGTGFWGVVGHAEVGRVLRTPKEFSSSLGLTQVYDAPPPLLPVFRSMMINMDPPEHSRLRGLLTRAFTPASVARLEQTITARCEQLVDAVTPAPGRTGHCDFARDVVTELPLQTLADLLGMPEEDRWLMFDWANRVIGMLDDEYSTSSLFDATSASPMARAAMAARPQPDEHGRMPDSRRPGGMADLYAYARELAEHLRRHPGPDIMSLLLAAVDSEGGRVSADEFEKLFWLFCVAGNETVRNAIPGGMQALLEHPGERARLWADPSLVDGAVEEMLRWWTPVVHFRRTAAVDTELGGQRIRAGDKVVVFFTAANRDPSVFEDPARFDLTRSPNPHIAFGTGPHFCIGAMLARAQMRALFSTVVRRWSAVEASGPPERLRASFQNGIKHQPVTFVAR